MSEKVTMTMSHQYSLRNCPGHGVHEVLEIARRHEVVDS